MAYAIDAANKVHERQIAAATKFQDLILKASAKASSGLGGLREKAPKAPERVTAPLEKASEPVSKVFGSRQEIVTMLGKNARDWADLRQRFQASLFGTAYTVPGEPGEKPITIVKGKVQPNAKASDA
jgi:hypothetical protein